MASKQTENGTKSPWNKTLAVMLAFMGIAAITGCGEEAVTDTATGNRGNNVTQARTAASTGTVARTTPADSGPIMPNVDETQIEGVTLAATAAFERDWGDGSGVNVVWGPNIVSGWALIGMENNSGAAGKDVLLAQENGIWLVKDMGHALSEKWEGQTSPGLWPSM